MNPRHRQLLRLLLGPGVLLVAAAVAYIGIVVYGVESAGQVRMLTVAALLAILLMLLVWWRLDRAMAQQSRIDGRERALIEQQRAYDRLHSGVGRLRAQPWKSRWLELAERLRVSDPAVLAGWEQRYQELLAHPTRHTWAAEALKGNFPSDAEIDYETNPSLLLTCMHLQPVEAGIRSAGVYCSALSPNSIVTFASIHAPRARRHYSLPEFVEWQTTRESEEDPGTSALICRQCNARIQSGSGEPFPP